MNSEELVRFNRAIDSIIILFERDMVSNEQTYQYVTLDGYIDLPRLCKDLNEYILTYFGGIPDLIKWRNIVGATLEARINSFIERRVTYGSK